MSANAPVPNEPRPDGSPSEPRQPALENVQAGRDLTKGDIHQEIHVYNYPTPTPPTEPKPFTVPYPHNEFFTGREAVLTQLHDTLGQTGTAALSQTQAIHGLGGVGKTQTAVEYAYCYYQHPSGYDWVLWVNAGL